MKLTKKLDVEELKKSKIINDAFLILKRALELSKTHLETTEKVS